MKTLKFKIFTLACFAWPVMADEIKITVPITSHHVGSNLTYDYNETNYGLGFEFNNFGGIWFRNSYRKPTLGAYYSLNTMIGNYVEVGARLGILTGYERVTGHEISPVAMPYVGAIYDHHQLNISVIPTGMASDSEVDQVITLDYQYSF